MARADRRESHPGQPGSTSPSGRLHHVPRNDLSSATGQTPGMRRSEGISAKLTAATQLWMGESRLSPGAGSANHHHGASETAIYVLSGHPVFVSLEGGRERRLETSPGDYVFVPPFVPHREENPSTVEPAVVILARSTQEAIVVNLDDPSPSGAEPGGEHPRTVVPGGVAAGGDPQTERGESAVARA